MSTTVIEPVRLADNVRAFLSDPVRYTTIATINRNGSPHQIVIWYLLRHNDVLGDHIVVNSRRGRRWPSNLLHDARANVCVYEAEDAVTLECEVFETYDGEPAQADIAEMAYRYDSPEDAAAEEARFRTEDRVSYVLRVTRAIEHGSPR